MCNKTNCNLIYFLTRGVTDYRSAEILANDINYSVISVIGRIWQSNQYHTHTMGKRVLACDVHYGFLSSESKLESETITPLLDGGTSSTSSISTVMWIFLLRQMFCSTCQACVEITCLEFILC